MAEADLPGWFISASAIGTTFGAMALAIWQGRKRKAEASAEGHFGGATIVSDASIEKLTRGASELKECVHDDTRRLREAVEDNTRALRDIMPSRTTPDALLALTARMERIEKDKTP